MGREYLPVDQLQQQYLLCQLDCKVVIQLHAVSIEVEKVKGHREVIVLKVNKVKCIDSNKGDHHLTMDK